MRNIDARGMFKDWVIGQHYLTSPDGEITLWIANGLRNFGDDGGLLLSGLTRKEKKKIWQEYQWEVRNRCLTNLRKYANE